MHDNICDLETAPDPRVIEKISKLYPFNADGVSLDPRWKEETCERKIEEARNNHLPKMLDKAQLDPALSFICSFGLLPIDSEEPVLKICMSPEEEREGLEWIFDKMNDRLCPRRFIGFKFEGFDMEFMWTRAWIQGIKPPAIMRKGRYWNAERVVDLEKEWAFYNPKNPWMSLEKVVRILGIEYPGRPEGVTGKDCWNLLRSDDPEENQIGIAYACSDLFEEKSLALRIL
jgi:hypothetical protein